MQRDQLTRTDGPKDLDAFEMLGKSNGPAKNYGSEVRKTCFSLTSFSLLTGFSTSAYQR